MAKQDGGSSTNGAGSVDLAVAVSLTKAIAGMRSKGQTRACRSIEAQVVEAMLRYAASLDTAEAEA